MEKIWPKSRLRDGVVTGLCIYLGLTIDLLLLK
jgi:hypothetical protein